MNKKNLNNKKTNIKQKNKSVTKKTSPKIIITKKKKSTFHQPSKIIIETPQTKTENWFFKIIKTFMNIIFILLPLILIGGGIWLVIDKFFPGLTSLIGGFFEKTQNLCLDLHNKTKNSLENLGVKPQYSSILATGLWTFLGTLTGISCCCIPIIGPFIGVPVLLLTYGYILTTLTQNSQTPRTKNSPPQLIENKIKNPQIHHTHTPGAEVNKPIIENIAINNQLNIKVPKQTENTQVANNAIGTTNNESETQNLNP